MSRIVTDTTGKRYLLEDPVPLTQAPGNIQLATKSKPWKNYWRMLGTVIPVSYTHLTLTTICRV